MNELPESYSSKKAQNTRVKVKRKKTVGITLPPDLVEKARKHKLNISRITEQALLSVLDYMETQNRERPHFEGISTRDSVSLPQRLVARGRFELPSAGPEPAMLDHYTTGLLLGSVRNTFHLPNKYPTTISTGARAVRGLRELQRKLERFPEEINTTIKGFILGWLKGQIQIKFPTASEFVYRAKKTGEKLDLKKALARESRESARRKARFIDLILICSGSEPATPEEQRKANTFLFARAHPTKFLQQDESDYNFTEPEIGIC